MTTGILMLMLIIILSIFVLFPIWFLLTTYGIVMCKRNNSWGLLLLLSANFFGLLIGWVILFNNNHVKIEYKYKWLFVDKESKSNLKLWKEEKSKLSKRLEFLDKKINNENYKK